MKKNASISFFIAIGLLISSSGPVLSQMPSLPSQEEKSSNFQRFYNKISSFRPLSVEEAEILYEWGTRFIRRQAIEPELSQKAAKIAKDKGIKLAIIIGTIVALFGMYHFIQKKKGQREREDIEDFLYAAERGNKEKIINLLRERPLLLNEQGATGDTALIEAASRGYKDIVTFLLNKGAKVNVENNSGHTALSGAAFGGHKGIVQLLLKFGATINPENQITTPLMEAAFRGHEDIVKLLLGKGADIDAQDRYGHTPLRDAAFGGRKKIVELLLKSGATINPPGRVPTALMGAAFHGREAIAQLLLDEGADINAQDRFGNTALIAGSQKKKIVEKFLAYPGIKVDIQNKSGNTALMKAASDGYTEIVELLLDAGADKNLKNKENKTAADLARNRRHSKTEEVIVKYERKI